MSDSAKEPNRRDMDEIVSIPLDPELALGKLMEVDPTMNQETTNLLEE